MPDPRFASELPEDAVLLGRLASALAPPLLTGDACLLPAAAVQTMLAGRAASATPGSPIRAAGAARRRRPATAVAGMVGVLLVGGVSATAAGAPIPAALRAIAAHAGLPVAPSPVERLRAAMATLAADLVPGSGAGPAATARDAQAVVNDFRALDAADRAAWQAPVAALLQNACTALAGRTGTAAAPFACGAPVSAPLGQVLPFGPRGGASAAAATGAAAVGAVGPGTGGSTAGLSSDSGATGGEAAGSGSGTTDSQPGASTSSGDGTSQDIAEPAPSTTVTTTSGGADSSGVADTGSGPTPEELSATMDGVTTSTTTTTPTMSAAAAATTTQSDA